MTRHGVSAYIRLVRSEGLRLQGMTIYIPRHPQSPSDIFAGAPTHPRGPALSRSSTVGGWRVHRARGGVVHQRAREACVLGGKSTADKNPTLDRAWAPTLGQSEITEFRRSAGRAHDLWEGTQGSVGVQGEYIGYIEPNSDERGPPACVTGAPKSQLTVIKHRAARSAWCSKKHAVFAGVAPGTALSLLL
jgi:hypothetical protein